MNRFDAAEIRSGLNRFEAVAAGRIATRSPSRSEFGVWVSEFRCQS